MNKSRRSAGRVVRIVCTAFAAAFTGCTTYVEHRPPRTVYVPPPPPVTQPPPPAVYVPLPPPVVTQPPPPAVYVPPPAEEPVVVTSPVAPVVVIQTENDFYEPLSPHGEWVVVASYGRCWRPTRVVAGWRPYCEGHWRRTDAGWYWASDEPWGWATYHYGRWDWSVGFGWFWVPHTQWAPAWVSWRQGAGYVGWAPLPPSARIGARGMVEIHERAFAPHAFVFVSEQRLLEPVRPTTVIVNNNTVINQTVNITKIQVVNQTVINEGPRPEIIERRSGRKVEAVPVRDLRRQEETQVAARQRTFPSPAVSPPARTESAPTKTVPARERSQVGKPPEATELQPPPQRNEARKPADPKTGLNSARPEVENRVRTDTKRESNGDTTRSIPANGRPRGNQEAQHDKANLPRETQQAAKPAVAPQQPGKTEVPGASEVKSSARPMRLEPPRPLGHERQREAAPVKVLPATEQPTAVRKSTPPPRATQAEQRKKPEKPVSSERGEKNARKEKKKAEEPETQQPAVPPRAPQ